ncbi:aldo/keto reductase [Phormidium yuhuli AB48]|uniref:Aldo/keto reductase n=1 Tax=Phormidium yuhuli AB48 TaxID=2940671 RepID=A0ABY5ARV3_9CYAN|nr:aldo/keto reductase [Phormidium yuhuli]USR91954.1 aldo/keto reductase [Phormidium yuhuli AB48]
MEDMVSLGDRGLQVRPLGIGAWSWGDRFFWQYGSDYGEAQVREAFETAVASGITLFDTAEVYGKGESEQLLGRFGQTCDTPVYIATKYGPLPWRLFKSSVYDAVSASLERLQLDSIPLYQVHWPFTCFMSQETLLNALADEVERGRIQAVGVSNYSADEMVQAQQILQSRGVSLAVNQVRYSLLSRTIETKGILDTAKDLGVVLLAYSPLAQGLLTGKYTPSNPPGGARKMDAKFSAKGLQRIEPLLGILRDLGQQYQKTPAQVALNWLIGQGGVIPIPGAKNGKQAQDNAGALGWQLSSEDWIRLEQASRPWL